MGKTIELKLAHASWHAPTLLIDCPHCDEWNDYWDQVHENTSIVPFESYGRDYLEGDEFICPDCKKSFELESIEY